MDMRPLALLFALVVAVAALLVAGAGGTSAPTELRMTLWPEGKAGPSRSWTLRCAPARGSLPNARSACARLRMLERPFAPVPRDAVCTMIYGGPAEGLVRGTLRGRRVRAEFSLRGGCEIERWRRVRFLFPALRLAP